MQESSRAGGSGFKGEMENKYCNIQLIPDKDSQNRLRDFFEENSNVIKNPKQRFHSTIHYSEEVPIFEREQIKGKISTFLPITLSPEVYSLNVFEDSILVLKYTNKKIEVLNKIIVKEALRQIMAEWPGELSKEELERLEESPLKRTSKVYDYNSHISLATDFYKQDLEKLTSFEQPISFDSIEWNV